MRQADVIVIGGGIAGVSLAGTLAKHRKAIVLEREDHPAYHSTGRSAAVYGPGYGNQAVRLLTAAGEGFFRGPPTDFSETAIFRPRDWVHIATADQLQALAAMKHELGNSVDTIAAADLEALVPILKPGYVREGLIDRGGGDLDVDAILQGYLRQMRRNGGELICGAAVEALEYDGRRWLVRTSTDRYAAKVVVNAAGAWADEIALRAGLSPLGLVPKRRTALLLGAPQGMEIGAWPLVVDIDEQFYFKPDAGQIFLSPADETPTPPCDAAPDEMDVAIAIDRFEKATTMRVARVNHKWAGLRVFAPDKTPIAGFDPRCKGLFWLAGHGGYGVQTAPGLSQFAASLILEEKLAAPYHALEALTERLSPARLIT